MNRISVFARRQRIKNLETWTIRAIAAEAFCLAIFPELAAVAVLVGIVAWFLRLQIDTKFKMRSLPFDVPVTIFIVLGAVSVFMSPARDFELIYNYCEIVGLYALTYLLVGQNIRTPEQVRFLAKGLGAALIFVVLYGYFQYIFGVEISEMKWIDGEAFPEMRKRIFSTLENPNVLAGYLDVMICIALGLLAKFGTRKQKFILLAVIVALIVCLAMTYSRGAFLSLAIILVIYAFMYDWRILTFLALVMGVLFYTDENLVEKVIEIFTTTNDTAEGLKVGIWVSTISMISDHPFIGVGWGAYKFLYPHYNYYLADSKILIDNAHNLYLQTAAEVGIAGALSYFWYFFGTMFAAWRSSYEKVQESGSYFYNLFQAQFVKVFMESKFLQEFAQAKSMFMLRMADLTHKILDKVSPSNETKTETKKTVKKKPEPELVHHDELKFSSKKKPKDEKKSDDDNIDIQKFAENISVFEPDRQQKIADRQFAAGMKLGIGLAFLSMALNGMSDDLLFNVPSSILMWMLGALGAAINLFENED